MKPGFAMLLMATLAGKAFPQPVSLTGAGSTFINPIASRWIAEYHKLHPEIEITYHSVGSGEGIAQVVAGDVDFGATDGPMTFEQLQTYRAMHDSDVLHIPAVLGAVVPAYNIPSISGELNFTPEALAGIFLGKVQRWNSSALLEANPGVNLPDAAITVVHRSDGSGTTYVWTDYLAKASLEWMLRIRVGVSVVWPVGIGKRGNEGVAEYVKSTPYSLGYVELGYALQKHLAYGRVKNAAGHYCKAEARAVTAAADALAKNMPADFRTSITNAPGEDSYPISSFSWLLIPSRIPNVAKRRALNDFVRWVLSDGQSFTEPLSYAPVPPALRSKELQALAKLP